jgi:hypothetical protein
MLKTAKLTAKLSSVLLEGVSGLIPNHPNLAYAQPNIIPIIL